MSLANSHVTGAVVCHSPTRGCGLPPIFLILFEDIHFLRPKATGGGSGPTTSPARGQKPRSILAIVYILEAHVPFRLVAVLIVDRIFSFFFNHRRIDNMLHPHTKTCQKCILRKQGRRQDSSLKGAEHGYFSLGGANKAFFSKFTVKISLKP
jgi:hypothetical protein